MLTGWIGWAASHFGQIGWAGWFVLKDALIRRILIECCGSPFKRATEVGPTEMPALDWGGGGCVHGFVLVLGLAMTRCCEELTPRIDPHWLSGVTVFRRAVSIEGGDINSFEITGRKAVDGSYCTWRQVISAKVAGLAGWC